MIKLSVGVCLSLWPWEPPWPECRAICDQNEWIDGFHSNVHQFCLKNIVLASHFKCFRFYFNQCVFRFLACSHLPSLTFMNDVKLCTRSVYIWNNCIKCCITDFKRFMFSSFWFTFHEGVKHTFCVVGGREGVAKDVCLAAGGPTLRVSQCGIRMLDWGAGRRAC